MKKIKTQILRLKVLSLLCLLTLLSHTSYANETVSGTLKYLQAANGNVFLAIDSTKKVSAKDDSGQIQSSKLLQLAIPNPELGKKAMTLIGKEISCQGKPMTAHTQHHYTDVLWIVDSIELLSTPRKQVEAIDKRPAIQDEETPSNPNSIEWN